MANITERYNTAVHARSLKVDPTTRMSDSDVLGAYGLAAKREPLAVALERLFAGDGRAAREIVDHLAQAVFDYSFEVKVKISRVAAADMAKACLAWHRDGTCRPCGGHGYHMIPGAPMLSEKACQVCAGSGKVILEMQFPAKHEVLVRWMAAELARESGRAGPEAMRKLAEKMEF